MKLLGRSGVLAWTFYLWSVLWVSLFPILNVSSGELKPRGLFVDENAYMSGMLSGRAALLDSFQRQICLCVCVYVCLCLSMYHVVYILGIMNGSG
jgi:hypothetical protein